jgi:hypothetical protein
MSHQRPYGRHYPTWIRRIVLTDPSLAPRLGISSRTLRRWRQNFYMTGSVEPGRYSPGRPRRLSTHAMVLLAVYLFTYPGMSFFSNSFHSYFIFWQQFCFQMLFFLNVPSFWNAAGSKSLFLKRGSYPARYLLYVSHERSSFMCVPVAIQNKGKLGGTNPLLWMWWMFQLLRLKYTTTTTHPNNEKVIHSKIWLSY